MVTPNCSTEIRGGKSTESAIDWHNPIISQQTLNEQHDRILKHKLR